MDLSGVADAVLNCLQFHSNEIVSTIHDERDFLRLWRRRWRDAVDGENARLFRFLQSARDMSDAEFTTHLREIPPNSDWFRENVSMVVDLSGVVADLESMLHADYNVLRAAQHLAQNRYAFVCKRLFELEDILNNKLYLIKTLESHLSALQIIDLSGCEASTLQTSILGYVRGVYRETAIDDTYREFVRTYAEWHLLRGLVLGTHVARSEVAEPPICSICTNDRISCTLIPCGHTFCNNCAQRQRHLCYVCRSQVRERMRIYFV
jgi:hypothetical protein